MQGSGQDYITNELHALYYTPNVLQVIESSRMRWERHAGRMGERRGPQRDLVGKPEGSRPSAHGY